MSDDLRELSRLVADLDVKLSPAERYRAARYLALCRCQREDEHSHICEECGAGFEQPRMGRPRKYCYDCSPPRSVKSREKSTLAA